MPPVSPGQPSSFGSVFSDAPGMVRETGYTRQFTLCPSATDADLPICSATGPTAIADGQITPFLAPLNPGDTLLIYGMQGINATTSNNPMAFSLRVGDHDATDPTIVAGTANAFGPWFQHFNLPIAIQGPATGTKSVWLETITPSDGNATVRGYNRVTLEYVMIRKA